MLTWLHISDLQLQRDSESAVLNKLLDDVSRSAEDEDLRPDFICVTGDLAYLGQQAEYSRAQRFFDQLLTRTSVPKEQLFIIPGNHDIDELMFERQQQSLEKAATEESANVPDIPLCAIGLDAYFQFVTKLLGSRPKSNENQFYVRRFKQDRTDVAVLGFNTAWMGNVEPYPTGQVLHEAVRQFRDQVERALEQVRDAEVKIALVHHPLAQLRRALRDGSTLSPDQEDEEDPTIRSLLVDCDFILHSHVYSQALPGVTSIKPVVINGGSLPGIREHPNAYNWVRANFLYGVCTVYLRVFSEQQGGVWIPGGRAPNGTSFRLWDQPLAGFAADTTEDKDQLDITPDVNAFSSVFASTEVNPPLCLGLFGEWGSGKTFFMDQMEKRIKLLAERALEAEGKDNGSEGEKPLYHSHIVQIRFNAWHYIDTNLWASLANHIFKELAAAISGGEGKSKKEKEEKAKLLQDLEAARKQRDEAARKQEEAEQRLATAEKQLQEAQAVREKEELELGDLVEVTWQEVTSDEAVKKELDETSQLLGLPSAIQNPEELDATLQGLHTFWDKFKASFQTPTQRRSWLWASLLVFLVIPLAAFILNCILNDPKLIRAVASIVAIVTAWLTAINPLLKPIFNVVKKLGNVKIKLDQRLQEKRETLMQMEVSLQKELTELREQEGAAQETLAEAQARIDEAQTVFEEKYEQSLARFIQKRIASREYEKQLGIISVVHNDFLSLSEMLGSASDPDLPKIDRIILYIDDLDRCPEEKVTDVLQAVHLLLAFPLFIVVVGVDSRWLLRSLERSYPALQKRMGEQTGLSEEEAWAWESTPQDYLEKIFQIPFNLHRMDQKGTRKLVDSIIRDTASSSDGDGGSKIKPVVRDKEWDEVIALPPQPSHLGDDGADRMIGVDLTPPGLIIETWERDFIQHLAALLPTPRAVKRFVNIYRLIRAKIPPIDLPQFVGEEKKRGEFQVVMVLLATQTGFPRQASYVFGKILRLKEDLSWSDIVDALEPKELQGTEPQRFRNGMVPSMGAAEAEEWKRLHKALSTLEQKAMLPPTLEPCRQWVRRVARFSFRAGKIAEGSVE